MKMKDELARRQKAKAEKSAESSCQARRMCDQMVCRKCDLAWDAGDEDRPACR